jgi:RHS repeat-associated protein
LDIPIITKPGINMPFSLKMSYNSNSWGISGNAWVPNPVTNVSGFNYDFWTLPSSAISSFVGQLVTSSFYCDPAYLPAYTGYIDPSGNLHSIVGAPPLTPVQAGNCAATTSWGTVLEDGSGLSVYLSLNNPNTVTTASGIVYSGFSGSPTITDPDGNTLSLSGSVYTDTFGVQEATVGGGTYPTTYTYPISTPSGASTAAVTVTYTSETLYTNFRCRSVRDFPATAGYTFPTKITLADNSTYHFTYESQSAGTITGRLASVTYPNGRVVSYQYTGPNNGINCADGSAAGLTRTVTGDGVYQYTRNTSTWLTTTLVSDYGTGQANNTTAYTFIENSNNQLFLSEEVINQGSNTPLMTKIVCYFPNLGPSNCLSLNAPFYPIQSIYTYSLPAGATNYSLVVTTVDDFMNVLKTALYDFGATTPTRQTVADFGSSYNGSCPGTYIGNVKNVPCEVQVQNGSGAVLRSSYFTYGISVNPGSLLSEQDLTSGNTYLAKSWAYNSNGTLSSSTDYDGNITTFTQGECNSGLLSKVVPPISTLDTQFSWDCNGAKLLSTTDPNGNVVSSKYNDPLWRTTSVTDQLLNVTSFSYSPTTTESVLNWGSSTNDVYDQINPSSMTMYHQILEAPSSSNWDTTQRGTSWGSTGVITTTSMPCVTGKGSGCSNGKTSITHDALGRPLVTTDGGGGTLANTYTGSQVCTSGLPSCLITTTTLGPAPAGEVVKEVVIELDGLGQLVASCVVSSATGSSACDFGGYTGFPTKYTYNPDGTVASVAKSSATNTQTRSFTYDALGRTLTATYPESGTTTYVYDKISGVNGCTSTDYGQLVYSADANGNSSCFQHDSLNRVITISYAGPNVDGANKNFVYDSATVNGVTMTNTAGRLAEAYTSFAASGTTLVDEGFSYNARGELSDVYESTPNSGGYYHTTATYFPNHAVNTLSGVTGGPWTYNLDGKGRPYSAIAGTSTTLVSSTTYNAADEPCLITLGSGDTDSYVYDNNPCTTALVTGRTTGYTFSVGATPTTDVGLLTWNANGTLRSLAITDGFNARGSANCNYGSSTTPGYDEQGRLVSAVCANSSGTNVWGQSFSYDGFDNITKIVPTGDTGITWEPGYNQANNQYTLGGTSYDSNGNLLNDSFHTYTWNQDNHPLTVTGGTSGPVVYDALGRMVEHYDGSTYKQPLISPIGNIGLMNKTAVSFLRIPLPGGATYAGDNFWHRDWLGSVRLVSSRSGRTEVTDRAFAPYGETYNVFGSTSDVDFTGDNQDLVAGTFDTPNRELNPNQGRWISPDPAHSAWNAYGYSFNPLAEADPSGLGYTSPFTPSLIGGEQGNCTVDGQSVSCSIANALSQSGFGASCPNNDCSVFWKKFTGWFGGSYSLVAAASGLVWINNYNGEEVPPEFLTEQGLGGSSSAINANNFKPWNMRAIVVAVLRAKNDCSAWFKQGQGSAADIMSHVPILLGDPAPGPIPGPDASTSPDPTSPIYVSPNGRFYPGSLSGIPVGAVCNYDTGDCTGGFQPGTSGAQMIILFHEVAHKVGLIPSDRYSSLQSDKNIQTVMGHCAGTVH